VFLESAERLTSERSCVELVVRISQFDSIQFCLQGMIMLRVNVHWLFKIFSYISFSGKG
jgi:hypothetical protein